MRPLCDGRVAVVTGAGRGIGRGHALELARNGASVVVNDLGSAVDGQGADTSAAQLVVDEIVAAGGTAVANTDDVADWEGAQRLIGTAVDAFGRLDVLVNNAGILRDRMLFNMAEDEWDAVVRVHLKGTFAPLRWAADHWRERSKAGEHPEARVINTSSTSGLFANPGQGNYGAAKSGIATLSIIASKELARYGVTVNAIAPGALTRMTENLGRARAARTGSPPPGGGGGGAPAPPGASASPGAPAPAPAAAPATAAPPPPTAPTAAATGEDGAEAWDPRSPENIAPLVTWLASTESAGVTGRVFLVSGGRIAVAEGWRRGRSADRGARWDPAELGEVVPDLLRDDD